MNIGLACYHAGFFHKEETKKYLTNNNYKVEDFGCFSEESVDYPDFAHKLSISIINKNNDEKIVEPNKEKIRRFLRERDLKKHLKGKTSIDGSEINDQNISNASEQEKKYLNLKKIY